MELQTRHDEPLLDLTHVAELAVRDHEAAPCACVAAAVRRDGAFQYGAGAAGRLWLAATPPRDAPTSSPPLATVDTLFDLASVTKPVTALTLARLARSGQLRLDELLGGVLPELRSTRSASVPLELFAAHRAGLDGHRRLYAPLLDGAPVDVGSALEIAADARRAECTGDPPEEGFAPVYSDLGYLLLGAAVARRAGEELDAVVAREVTLPLGLHDWGSGSSAGALRPKPLVGLDSARGFRRRDARFDERVAPTEEAAFRGGVVRGAVHDENAWAIVGDGSAGHAGLFGDALSVARLGVALLEAIAGEHGDWLSPADIEPLLRVRSGGSLRAGFDGRSGTLPSSGARFGPRTFGHLGFTGTSLWIDPDAQLVGVLLTNRVHPTRASDAIRRARPAAYDAIAEAMMG